MNAISAALSIPSRQYAVKFASALACSGFMGGCDKHEIGKLQRTLLWILVLMDRSQLPIVRSKSPQADMDERPHLFRVVRYLPGTVPKRGVSTI